MAIVDSSQSSQQKLKKLIDRLENEIHRG